MHRIFKPFRKLHISFYSTILSIKRRSVVAVKRGKPECFKWPCVRHHFSHQRSDLMTQKIFRRGISIFWGVAAESAAATVIPMIARLWQGLWEDSCQMRSLARIWWERRLRRAAPGVHCAAQVESRHQEVSPFNRKWTLIYNRHFLNVRHEEFPHQKIKAQEI